MVCQENNLALQQQLYNLRSETKDFFDEAKKLESRWKELEKEQRDIYQFPLPPLTCCKAIRSESY